MPSIHWYSLKPFTFSQLQKITVSYGIDGEEVICVRADIRGYYNSFPTRNGVNLKRWELIQLGRFLSDIDQNASYLEETADELTMTKLENGMISLNKRYHRYLIDNSSIHALREIIPGVCLMLEILRDPIARHPPDLLQDVFIYSQVIGDSPGLISEPWEIETEVIIDGNMNKLDDFTPSSLWDYYQAYFGAIPNLSAPKEDFINKFKGSFTVNLQEMLKKDEGSLMRSLALFVRQITK